MGKELVGPEEPVQPSSTGPGRAEQEDHRTQDKGEPLTSGPSLEHQSKSQAIDTPNLREARAQYRPDQE